MKAFVESGGTRFTEHEIRATAADEPVKMGGDPTALLAHSDAKTTQIYLRKKDRFELSQYAGNRRLK